MRKKRVLYILGALLIIAGAAALYVYKEYTRTHKDTAELSPDYTAGAITLISEFEKDEQTSNNKYWDKVIEVEGVVKEVAKDEGGSFAVVLGDTASMASVRCSVDSIHGHQATLLKKGNPAIVKGICSGYQADELLGSDVILVRCVIVTKK